MKLNHALRTFVLATVVSLAAGICSTANATVTDLGLISEGAPTIFQGTVMPAGTFTDTFTFILPPNGGSGYSVLNFPVTSNGQTIFNTLFTSMTLVSDPDGIPFNRDDKNKKTVVAGQNAESLSMVFEPTAGGHMYLIVAGATNGTLGGLYSGAISVSPVPEPGVWLMMLGGIGLLGWVRLRNGKAQLS